MKKIFVTTNFDKVSENAMEYAAHLAIQTGAELTIINAYHLMAIESDDYLPMRMKLIKEIQTSSEKRMLEWCKQKSVDGNFEFQLISEEGFAAEVILNAVTEHKPDILVMGTRKANVIDKIIFGSLTGRMLKEIDVPLLVIPEDFSYRPFDNILFATDVRDNDIESLLKVIEIGAPNNALITMLHATNLNDRDSEFDIEYFEELQADITSKIDYPRLRFDLIHATNLVKSLDKYSDLDHSNLLIMEHSKRNRFERLFNPSASLQEFYRLKIPALFFQAN